MAECLRQGHFFQEFGFQPPPNSDLEVGYRPFDSECGSRDEEEGQGGEEDEQKPDLINLVRETKLEYLGGGELMFPDFLGKLNGRIVESLLQQMREFGIDVHFEEYDKLPTKSRDIFVVDEVLSALCFADRRVRQAAYKRHLEWTKGTNRPRMRDPDDYRLPPWIPEELLEMTLLADEELVTVVRG